MSVSFPWTGANGAGNTGYRLDLPTTVNAKAASTAYTTLFFFRTPSFDHPGGASNPVVLASSSCMIAKAGGAAGGSDGNITLSHDGLTLTMILRSQSSTVIFSSASITLQRNKRYLCVVIGNSTNKHMVVCECGQSALPPVTQAGAEMFNANMSTNRTWASVGGGSANAVRPCYNSIEEFCMWTGEFPETAGVPDLTLIAAIAAGTQSLDTLHTDVSPNLTRKFRFRLRDETDLTLSLIHI